ncbi:MAG: CPBP family intramembrane metalloprotease [Candidatus Symbiothrix sp.]|jgi:hypothetical protein|nr:CPBP family intramembrane metalloprotease [Candidatus Symbiothrix sp.]
MPSISFKDLIRFIKDPYASDFDYNSYPVKQKSVLFVKLFFFSLIITYSASIFISIEKSILTQFGIEIKNLSIKAAEGNYTELLMIIFFIPLLEEIIFRLSLSFRKRDITIVYFVLLGVVIINLNIFDTDIMRRLVSFSLLFLSALAFYFWDKIKEDSLKKIKTNYGKYIVWVSIVLFACAHISNIANFDLKLLPIYLINVSPMFLFAIFATFCRLKLGFLYGVLLHIGTNILPALSSQF